ncbi:MAG: hypothetical protein E7031_04515 [Akkermansiaceae bacterium]|nr:hypothetical protein [Akkermansiaceae bacterium]
MKALLTIIVGSAVLHHTASALPAVQESATKIAANPYLRVQQEYVQLHCELKFCLQAVQDKDSADKAAQSVKALTERLIILQNKEKQLPSPPAAIISYLEQYSAQTDYKALIHQGIGKAVELYLIQDPPCYGSEALQAALAELLDRFCGEL